MSELHMCFFEQNCRLVADAAISMVREHADLYLKISEEEEEPAAK